MMSHKNRNHRACFYPLRLLGILLVLLLCSLEPVQSSSVNEIEILIPVDPYKLPDGLTLVGPALKEIELRVKGPLSALKDLRRNVPRYKLDLSGVAVGVESIAINPDLTVLNFSKIPSITFPLPVNSASGPPECKLLKGGS